MKINAKVLIQNLNENRLFTGAEELSSGVVRATKRANNNPYAVCYFDISNSLPKNQEDLDGYLDVTIGTFYFEEDTVLQWNSYLYFILDDDAFREPRVQAAKRFIERDRKYARKFVVAESEKGRFTEPLGLFAGSKKPSVNIRSDWQSLLESEGLVDALFLEEMSIPKRLEIIERSQSIGEVADFRSSAQDQDEGASHGMLPFIEYLKLADYRQFPLKRKFEFGSVNLISGENGVGKTSLLEAIELYYCGRGNRNRSEIERYSLEFKTKGGALERVDSDVQQSVFRDRNLEWYGQPELRTHNIDQSFAQYNFLNTDAAVSLANSSEDFESELSKLLIGSDAARIWNNLDRVSNALEVNLRATKRRKEELEVSHADCKSQIERLRNSRSDSDALGEKLSEMCEQLGWYVGQSDGALDVSDLLESMIEIDSIGNQALDLGWVESPISIENLHRFLSEAGSALEVIEQDYEDLMAADSKSTELDTRLKQSRGVIEIIKKAEVFFDSGFVESLRAVENARDRFRRFSNTLVGVERFSVSSYDETTQKKPLNSYLEEVRRDLRRAQSASNEIREEWNSLRESLNQRFLMVGELRSIVLRLLDGEEGGACPVCHTQFGKEELKARVERDMHEDRAVIPRDLLERLESAKLEQERLEKAEHGLKFLENFAARRGISNSAELGDLAEEVSKAIGAKAAAQEVLNGAEEQLSLYTESEFSKSKWEQLRVQIENSQFSLSEIDSARKLKSLREGIVSEEARINAERDEILKKVRGISGKIRGDLDSLKLSGTDIGESIILIRKRLSIVDVILEKFRRVISDYQWDETRPISELVVESASVKEVATKYDIAISRERESTWEIRNSEEKLKGIRNELAEVGGRLERFVIAAEKFQKMRTELSLENALKESLQENRTNIEAIFSKIHSPCEFLGLGESYTSLIRKDDKSVANLAQISTGQRSAFALSIFLARNAQLKSGPPVILIDDPVAHVDDLNSLSFLDFLREITLTGMRQVFFATADRKFGALFRKKFQFLGPEFKEFELGRDE